MTDDNVIEISLYVAARPETVFPYFTDPSRYVLWMGSDATLDPVPGGVYRVRTSGGFEASGEFIELDPPRRIVFTWGWSHDPVPPGTTRVVITLAEEAGGTRVLLRHHDLPESDQRDHHEKGWDTYLGRLQMRIQGIDPGPDPN